MQQTGGMTGVAEAVDRVWRADAASMLGVLARRLGDLDRAEEALQDALAEALKHWADEGVPPQPGRLAGHHRLAQGGRPAPPARPPARRSWPLAGRLEPDRAAASRPTTTGSP